VGAQGALLLARPVAVLGRIALIVACLPLASAISSLMRFLLQYIAVGTSV